MSETGNQEQFSRLNQTRNKTIKTFKKSNTKVKIRAFKLIYAHKNFSSSSELKRFSCLNNLANPNHNSNKNSNNSNNLINNSLKNNSINNDNVNNNLIIPHPDKRSLFLRKLNLDDKKNLYFKEGVQKLFSDKNIFLENKYKGKPIAIGKSKHFNQFLRPPSFAFFSNTPSQKQVVSRQAKSRIKTRSVSYSRTNTINQNSSSNSFMNSRYYGKKNFGRHLNKNEKEENISDEKLKNIYQEFLNREINNKEKNKTIDIVELRSAIKKK